jgi:hypothetical protein
MICNCGATVKASANKTGITRLGRSAHGPKVGCAQILQKPAGEQQRPARSG